MKKSISILSGIALLAMGGTAIAEVKNPNTFTYLTNNDITTLDPAYLGNSAGTFASYNVYSRLIDYDGENIAEFVPSISSEVPTIANGLINVASDGKVTYTFPIREGVKAHKVGVKGADGSITWSYYDDLSEADRAKIEPGHGEITAEDVRYSLMRAILQGESWMANAITEMITAGEYADVEAWAKGVSGVDNFDDVDEAGLNKVFDELAQHIQVIDDKLVITLDKSFPATLGILALPFGTSIVDKEWAVDQNDWDGTTNNWKKFHKPLLADDPLFAQENGSGPFFVENWDRPANELTMKRFEGFFRKPAPLERVVIRVVSEWTNRRLQLLAGDADYVHTPSEFVEEMRNTDGIAVEDIEQIYGESLFYAWPVNSVGNDAIGSGKLDGKGIPADFFGNLDVRKAFNYSQNYDTILDQLQLGRTVQLRGPTVKGLMGYRDDSPIYSHDPEKATEHFKAAYDGKLWENGFEFTAYVGEGSPEAVAVFSVLQQSLARINPKFRMKIQSVSGSSMDEKLGRRPNPDAPLTLQGWGPDYSDPGGPLGASTYYLMSTGPVASFSGEGYRQLMADKFDPILNKAWDLSDPKQREPLYAQAQAMSNEYATSQFLWQVVQPNVTRDWVHGFVNNKVLYGTWNFYDITKEEK